MADVFGGRSHGVPRRWRQLIRTAVSRVGPTVLNPLFAPGYSVIPDCVTPTVCMPDGDAASQFAQLADLSPDTLLDELETEFGGTVPPQWRLVVDHPQQWIHAYVGLLQCVWREFHPIWRSAEGLIRRETERVGAALVQGCAEAVLQGLSGRFHLAGDSLQLPDPQGTTYTLDERRLVLVPVVSGPGASMFAMDRTDMVWIGYPLPGIGRLWESSAVPVEPTKDALSLVVGQLRAVILRAAAQPLAMGELAVLLNCSPANATHHCSHLVDAGLLERHREGRNVRIGRTERGDAVVDLLSQARKVPEGFR
ncbi:helix-turn-helix domain-containing protein [Streptomyces sp. BK208]|uniref:ArsR/SmtB family transcription factor n=1 Tax=Streptomyces sp. BK208 TaxID=2512150 RepID=UPI00105D3E9C|nr:helix-turn-helix domain-containing protein [Streptomyces sp. BK208]